VVPVGGFDAGPGRRCWLSTAAPSRNGSFGPWVLAVLLCAALAEYAAAEGRHWPLSETLVGLRRAVSCLASAIIPGHRGHRGTYHHLHAGITALLGDSGLTAGGCS